MLEALPKLAQALAGCASSSEPSGVAGLLKHTKSYHDFAFEGPEDDDYLQEKGYGAVPVRVAT